jgi:glycosyltransferase involved in cell wall biosynthesis
MRFCTVLSHYPKDVPGGAEYQAYLICRELAERGHDSHYVAHDTIEESTLEDEGITVHKIDRESTEIATVLTKLKEINADVFYFRNIFDIGFASICRHAVDGEIVFNISHDKQCRPIKSPPSRGYDYGTVRDCLRHARLSFYKALLRTPDELFVQTEFQQEQLYTHRGLESTVIGNGHPVPEQPESEGEPPTVLWLASLKDWKQPMKFVEVASQCRDLDCRFELVGRPVDDNLKVRIEDRISDVPNVEYLGGCDIEESNQHIARSSLFVNTSDGEGFPNTFIQSWLRETPVISLSCDPDGILSTNQIGRVSGSIDRLEVDVRELVSDDELRRKIGHNARQYAIENHSTEAIVDRLLEEIEK